MGEKVIVKLNVYSDGRTEGLYYLTDNPDVLIPFTPTITGAGRVSGTVPMSWWDRLKAWLRGEKIYTGGDIFVTFGPDDEEGTDNVP